MAAPDLAVRQATAADAEAVGRLLHDFNSEYDDVTPGPAALAERVRELLAAGDTKILVGGPGPDGLAVLRFRPSIWSQALECHLAELYVVSERRGQGLGRALMQAAMQLARDEGADHMDLGTSEDDTVARRLYESLGFSNREGKPDGPVNYVYERELRDLSILRAARSSQRRPSEKEDAMKYMLLIHQCTTPTPRDPEAWATLSTDEQNQVFADYKALDETPGVAAGQQLDSPETATTVRVQDGRPVVTDGPFAELKEAIGGYLFFEADDLDAAIEVAARIPAARMGGAVEVRRIVEG